MLRPAISAGQRSSCGKGQVWAERPWQVSPPFEPEGLTPGDPLDEVRSLFVQLLEQHVHANGPFLEIPGASDFLRRLDASANYAVAFATGGWRESAMLKLDSAGLAWNGWPLASSNDHHERTGIMEIALSQLGRSFETITYYGDGTWDRDACLALGWNFVAVGPDLGGLESYHEHEVPV